MVVWLLIFSVLYDWVGMMKVWVWVYCVCRLTCLVCLFAFWFVCLRCDLVVWVGLLGLGLLDIGCLLGLILWVRCLLGFCIDLMILVVLLGLLHCLD